MIRLVYEKYGLFIEIKENEICNINIENPRVMIDFVANLWRQYNGQEGELLFSDGKKAINVSKAVEVIMNPFAIDCNDKRIITRLYKELNEIAHNQLLEEINELGGMALCFLDQLIGYSQYHLCSNLDLDVAGLLKLYNVRVDSEEKGLIEKLFDYIRAISTICGIQIVVFLNLDQYLTQKEMENLYEYCKYQKIYVINIRGQMNAHRMNDAKEYVIDKDLCIWQA